MSHRAEALEFAVEMVRHFHDATTTATHRHHVSTCKARVRVRGVDVPIVFARQYMVNSNAIATEYEAIQKTHGRSMLFSYTTVAWPRKSDPPVHITLHMHARDIRTHATVDRPIELLWLDEARQLLIGTATHHNMRYEFIFSYSEEHREIMLHTVTSIFTRVIR